MKADIAMMLKLIESIEDKTHGVDNAKFIALTLCALLTQEQCNDAFAYLVELGVMDE
ncbi:MULTISPECIES: hypothetical protein [Vibrio]|jgi:hypothetical protein|uniref:hypothetical protein n=1 Tax=Vibrio TaxID=662 RepID=UPI000B31F2AA|nr:hypothetical protein [Vibrio lentus]